MAVLEEQSSTTSLTTWALAATFAGLVGWFLLQQTKKKLNLPPGPTGWPVVGSLFNLGEFSHEKFIEYSKKYGNVFSVQLGSHFAVVLSDADTMNEVLHKSDEFADRPDFVNFRVWYHGRNQGMGNMCGQTAMEHRRFFLRSLRDFGMGRPIMEEKIQHHYEVLSRKLADIDGKPTDPGPLFGATVSNVIMSVLMGRNYDLDDPVFKRFLVRIDEVMELIGGSNLMNFMPWLLNIPGMDRLLGVKRLRDIRTELVDGFIAKAVKQHFDEFDPNNIHDVMDEYIRTLAAKDGVDTFSVANCVGISTDFFLAGTETLTTTMKFAFILMMQNPEIQRKIQKELDDVVGRGRNVTMKDKSNLPYTEAAITEFQRRGSIVPLSVLHSNPKPAKINNYDIPAKSWIFPNLYQAMLDGKQWDDPLKCKPERFLSADGKFKAVSEADGWMPFGIGKRICPGMMLAKIELFIILPNLLQNFSIKLPAGARMPQLEEATNGIVLAPRPFKCCFVPR